MTRKSAAANLRRVTIPATNADVRLQVTYDGPAVASGRMDIRVLASAMASVAQLVDDAARISYGTQAQVRIEVGGDFRRGSFSYELVTQALQHLSADQLRELLEWLGLLAAPTGVTVLGVIRWLRGRKVQRAERSGKEVNIIVADGDSRVVNMHIGQLVLNPTVRMDIQGVMQPLESAGIDEFRAGAPGAEPVRVTADEQAYFNAPPAAAEKVHDAVDLTLLQLVSPIFRDGNKWQFSYPGEGPFHAAVTDKKFLREVKGHIVQFGYGDLIRVRLRTTVTRTELGQLRTDREVVEVVELIPPAKQTDLFDEA